jgi:hypothetical protein
MASARKKRSFEVVVFLHSRKRNCRPKDWETGGKLNHEKVTLLAFLKPNDKILNEQARFVNFFIVFCSYIINYLFISKTR